MEQNTVFSLTNDDMLIIRYLSDLNTNYSSIAKNLNVSRETIRRRINNFLFSRGRFLLRVNYYKLGLSVLVVLCREASFKFKVKLNDSLRYSKELNSLTYVIGSIKTISLQGSFRVIVVYPPIDYTEIYRDYIIEIIGKKRYITSFISDIPVYFTPPVTPIFDLWHNFIHYFEKENVTQQTTLDNQLREEKLDKIDLLILEKLEINPLRSLSDIARELSISPQLIHYHYNKHLKNVILSRHFRPFLGEREGLKGILLIEFSRRLYMQKFINLVSKTPSTISIYSDILNPRVLWQYQISFLDYKPFIKSFSELIDTGIVKRILDLGIMSNYLVTRYIISYHKCYKNGKWIIDPVVKEWAEEKGLLPRGERVGTL